MHILRGQGKIALAVAPTGIASTLLDGGRTLHSRFKLPVPFDEKSVSTITPSSPQAKILRDASLIIWDEAPMSPSLHLTEISRLLGEIMSQKHLAFGGKTVLLGGDFMQVLPVVPRASRSAIINASIKRNPIWPLIRKFTLTTNMRTDPNETEFADWLLKLGSGTIPSTSGLEIDTIPIPEGCVLQSPVEDFVFGEKIDINNVDGIILRNAELITVLS